MSKLTKVIENKNLNIQYLTAGDPTLADTKAKILEMEKNGVTAIVLDVPFSDPTAEGPAIQAAHARALENGCHLPGIFEMIAELRKESQIPVVIGTYMNPVFNYGYEAFCKKCSEVGVDGAFFQDLPYEERAEIAELAAENGIDILTIVAPTSAKRIEKLVTDSTGFIYAIPPTDMECAKNLVAEIKKYTALPVVFGIYAESKQDASQFAEFADGYVKC